MRAHLGLTSVVLAAVLAGCASTDAQPESEMALALWGGPMEAPLADRVQVWNREIGTNDLGRVAWQAVDDGVQVLFLGETHLDDVTHQVELEMLRSLIQWTQGKVVLSMEQFEWDVQPVLDAYLAGEIDEAEFLAKSRPWGNYGQAYRPLIELAKKAGVPVIAGNFPTPLRRKVQGRAENWAKLSAEERKWTPDEILLHTSAYWARVDRATAGHGPAGGAPPSAESRRYSTQALWDNAMAEGIARSLDQRPDHLVLHIAGKFHIEYQDGTVSQFAKRRPDVRTRTATILPRSDMWRPASAADRERADILIYAKPTARDPQNGRFGVQIGGELRYRAHVPKHITAKGGLPLLIWLGSTGCRDDEELRYWKAALGDAAIVVAVEPLHYSRGYDLRLGGRWFWDESFTSDVSRLHGGLERIVDYASRRLPVDADRVVLAGRGTGATALLWTAMYTDSIQATVVAAQPSRYAKLAMGGVPAQKSSIELLWGLSDEAGNPEFRTLLDTFGTTGLDTNLTTVPNARGDVLWELETILRRTLGLGRMTRATEGPVVQLKGPSKEPTALRWTALYARKLIAAGQRVERLVTDDDAEWDGPVDGGDSVLSIRNLQIGMHTETQATGEVTMRNAWSTGDLLTPGALPAAPGPFGGTTVLVVPAGTSPGLLAMFEAIESHDPLQAISRFHRLRVVAEADLPDAMSDLHAAARRNVLIVPAVFYADGAVMRRLQSAIAGVQRGMTVHWMPGLGGRLANLPLSGASKK